MWNGITSFEALSKIVENIAGIVSTTNKFSVIRNTDPREAKSKREKGVTRRE